jgi:hypothetical protein
MPSYSVKCHFEWSPKKTRTLAHLYEERITLWQADTIEDANEEDEREAMAYAEQHGFTFIELSQAFWMFSDLEGDGIELFSLLRESDFEPSAYLDHYHDTGFERESKQAEQVVHPNA